ncbi:hypothetical protein Drose_06290 [Dactylosporangium roseum]|uniref:Uncharacterized protein n=1 Tax=Dactylosporangium roseum TaxID=47989 RepID=A0ABY5Z750_9ACTN|nr:hypothetical protein [Dactylosporangium roseum]UWZ37881.1 hypothetical protein Drose_06290 [Dactylosporangium roseum]
MVSIEDLEQRLKAAERVCQLVGVTAASMVTARDKAELQAWLDWHRQYGHLAEPVGDDEITALAARRDEIYAAALARLRAERAQ